MGSTLPEWWKIIECMGNAARNLDNATMVIDAMLKRAMTDKDVAEQKSMLIAAREMLAILSVVIDGEKQSLVDAIQMAEAVTALLDRLQAEHEKRHKHD